MFGDGQNVLNSIVDMLRVRCLSDTMMDIHKGSSLYRYGSGLFMYVFENHCCSGLMCKMRSFGDKMSHE